MLSNKYKNEGRPNTTTSSTSGGYKEENGNVHIEKSKDTMSSEPRQENSEFKNKRVPLDGIEFLLNREKIPDDLGKRMDKKNIKEKPRRQINTRNDNMENGMLSDLDDIISDAESIQNTRVNPLSDSRKKARINRRVIKRKKDKFEPSSKSSFFPSSKMNRSSSSARPSTPVPKDFENLPNEPNDDVSDIVSDGEHHHEDVEEGENEEYEDGEDGQSLGSDVENSVGGEDNGSVSGGSEDSDYSGDSRSESGSERGSEIGDHGSHGADKKWKSPSEMTKDEIVSEKMDLLYRYGRLEGNGYKSGLSLNMRTPLETLRSEVNKLERMRNVQRSIRTQRKLLISFASGTEYCNKRYNPYKFALDGWSGEVLENIGDYDEVFEELHDKYKDSVQMAPELKLLTMVGGSGLMFHLSNTLFKSSTPQLNDILQKNPDIMEQIQREALNSMATTNSGDPIFGMMMDGIQEKQKQQSQQEPWEGRKGYAPPRTSQGFMQNPHASNANFSVGADVNQVPQGQGIPNSNSQAMMSGPEGFDDILNQLNSGNMAQTGLISDVEEDDMMETRHVQTKPIRKQRRAKKTKGGDGDVIDLDM
jgi:hypothetical protein